MVVSMVAMLAAPRGLWPRGKQGDEARRPWRVEEGDGLALFNVHAAFVAAKQSRSWCDKRGLSFGTLARASGLAATYRALTQADQEPMADDEVADALSRALIMGLAPANSARLSPDGQHYMLLRGGNGEALRIHPESVLFTTEPAEYVVFAQLTRTGFMRGVSVVDKDLLPHLLPRCFTLTTLHSAKRARRAV